MPKQMPDEFRSDEEMVEWFENADLSEYDLAKAPDVQVDSHVTLTIEDDLTETLQNAAAASRSTLTPVP
jgi:hypothetical protein